MFTHVVLLRGINVGKARRVPMAKLRALLLDVGCREARTLLNSGNAVVAMPGASPGTLARAISAAMRETFGFDVPVVVKSVDDLRSIVTGNRLATRSTDPSRLLVVFTQTSATLKTLASLSRTVRGPDRLQLGTRAAYLHCPNGILRSDTATTLLGKVNGVVTTRNWATVLKLHEIAMGDAG